MALTNNDDERFGERILKRALEQPMRKLEQPMRKLARNAMLS